MIKKIISLKKYIPIIFGTIFFYQILLVIFTYTKENVNILWILIVLYAIYIIIKNNSGIFNKIKDKIKKE